MPTFFALAGGIMVLIAVVLQVFEPLVSKDRTVNISDSKVQAMARAIDSNLKIIEAMDKTMRSQWETQRILYRRLGEPVPPPPVSITGLPDPEEN